MNKVFLIGNLTRVPARGCNGNRREVTRMKKLTYTKKEPMKEARAFSIYYGREELMLEGTRKRYEAFCEKCRIYEEEKHENQQK